LRKTKANKKNSSKKDETKKKSKKEKDKPERNVKSQEGKMLQQIEEEISSTELELLQKAIKT